MRYLLLVVFLLLSSVAQAAGGDLPEPDQAFKISTRVLDDKTLEVRYQIADGFYLYKSKFKFQAEPADVTLGAPQMPAGKIKEDEFFGKIEIYRNTLVIHLPYIRGSASRITLKATSQGCADVGVCYPPQIQVTRLDLPAPPTEAAGKSFILKSLSNQDEFLSPDKAFNLAVRVIDKNTLLATFTIADGYYLYRDKIKFALKNSSAAVQIDSVIMPPGDIKTDPNLGKAEVFHKSFQAVIVLKRSSNDEQIISLVAGYQGCSEKGVCYPPARKIAGLTLIGGMPTTDEKFAQPHAELAVRPASLAPPAAVVASLAPHASAPAEDAAPPAMPSASDAAATPSSQPQESDTSRIGSLLKGGNFWLILVTFFGFGLLLALTPCVFPMIPILSGIIIGQGSELTKSRAFVMSLAYVLGMAITYAAVGVAAGLSGTLLSAALQNPWVLGGFALVFVALALSMFGMYELQMPSFIQSRFTEASNKVRGGGLTSVFVMGMLSAVIVGPCVAAPLAGALLYISQTGNVVLGGSALFSLALGMGAPLLLVGVSAGALLPRAGGWMEAIKSFFGVLLLGVAIWLISPVIPELVQMLLWAALLIVSAIYLRAIDPLPHPVSGYAKLWKGIGVIALIAGVALLIGALSGSRDILQPLSGLRAPGEAKAAEAVAPLKFVRVKNLAELDQRIKQAKGKHVMLDFFADWCVSCKEFERFTFGDARVQAKLRDAMLLQADVTANSEDDKALLKKFGLFGPPGIIFFDKTGKELTAEHVVGYEPPEKFLASLDAIIR